MIGHGANVPALDLSLDFSEVVRPLRVLGFFLLVLVLVVVVFLVLVLVVVVFLVFVLVVVVFLVFVLVMTSRILEVDGHFFDTSTALTGVTFLNSEGRESGRNRTWVSFTQIRLSNCVYLSESRVAVHS